MTIFEFGDILLVNFPQSGLAARKQRPGLVVLDLGDADVVIAPITSRLRDQLGDTSVSELQGTGLILLLKIRLAKVATLLKSDVIRKLGRLSDADRRQVASTWQLLYANFVT